MRVALLYTAKYLLASFIIAYGMQSNAPEVFIPERVGRVEALEPPRSPQDSSAVKYTHTVQWGGDYKVLWGLEGHILSYHEPFLILPNSWAFSVNWSTSPRLLFTPSVRQYNYRCKWFAPFNARMKCNVHIFLVDIIQYILEHHYDVIAESISWLTSRFLLLTNHTFILLLNTLCV